LAGGDDTGRTSLATKLRAVAGFSAISRRSQMTKAVSTHRPGNGALWPWIVGALLVGVPLCIVMPPLVLVLILVLSVGLTRRDHPTASSRKVMAVVLGLAAVGFVYLVAWAAGGISW
jgi:hypothetical protein